MFFFNDACLVLIKPSGLGVLNKVLFFKAPDLWRSMLLPFTVAGHAGELPVSWERQTMGEQRTCDIRAVPEADKVQTRFRLVLLRRIKLIFMQKDGNI